MTLPLALDVTLLSVGLAGTGPALAKRLALLDGERVPGLIVFAPDADPDLAEAAGPRLIGRLPTVEEIASLRVLFVAGLPPGESGRLAGAARDHRVLVNVEDAPPLCDFHVPAIVRRGALAIAISTGGGSPTLARRLKDFLGRVLPPEWSERTERLAALRNRMRGEGQGPEAVMRAAEALIDEEGWLNLPR